MFAPDILRQIRVINKRIAVALGFLNTIIAVDLFLRDRVLTMPFHEQSHTVSRQTVIGRSRIRRLEEIRSFGFGHIFIPRRHDTHISAGEVAFILIHGFEDRSGRARGSGTGFGADGLTRIDDSRSGAFLMAGVRGVFRIALHFAIDVRATHSVYFAVGRHDMENIATNTGSRAAKPRFRDRVLAVITIAFTGIRTAFALVMLIAAFGIHIPYHTGFTHRVRRVRVGFDVGIVQTVIA